MTVGRIPNIEGGIQPTLLTTTGDIMYATAASTPARLGIGSSAQVLTVAAGVPSWATPAAGGGLTLINAGGTALSTGAVTVGSIPGTYKNLFIVVDKAYVADDSGNPGVYIRFNADSGSNYTYQTINSINTTLSGRGDPTQAQIEFSARISDQNTDIKKLFGEMTVRNYTNTDGVGFSSAANSFNTSEQPVVTLGAGSYDGAAAITSVRISTDSTFSGGTIYVYGVN